MCGEWEFGRRIALLFADSHRHSYSGCKPGVSDILCGTTALAAEANNIQKVAHVREKLSEFAGAAELAYAAGVAAAVYGEKTSSGVFFPNKVYANVGRRMTGELIYHEYNILTEIAGGIAVTLPFDDDFHAPDTKKYLDKFIVRNPTLPPDVSLKIWKFVENIGASPMSAWYEIAGVHGGGSPIMETIALESRLQLRAQEEACALPRRDRSRIRRLGRSCPGAHVRNESRGGAEGNTEKIMRDVCPVQLPEGEGIWLRIFWEDFFL